MRCPGLRVDHLHHHADDVTRRSELAIGAGGVEAAKQVLVEIALDVLVLRGDLHLVDGLARLDEKAWLVDLEFSPPCARRMSRSSRRAS